MLKPRKCCAEEFNNVNVATALNQLAKRPDGLDALLGRKCFHPEVIDYWLVLLVLLVASMCIFGLGTHISCISSLLKLDLFCLFCPVHCEQFTKTLESCIECVIGESGKLFRFEGLRLSRSSQLTMTPKTSHCGRFT